MRRFLTAIFTLFLSISSFAQYAYNVDSLSVKAAPSRTSFKATQLIAPGALLGAGIVIHCFAHDTFDANIQSWSQKEWRGNGPELNFDNYIQYAPLVMDLGLGFTGVKAEHHWLDRIIEAAVAHASLGVLSWGMKSVIDSPRPNGVDNNSFPSGHTDLVFTGAELVRMEYGWGWGAGAYAIATTVAVMRIYNNWHWASDVIFGAGLGILCAHIGGWLLEPTKNLFGIKIPDKIQIAVAPTVDPFSGSLCGALAMRF